MGWLCPAGPTPSAGRATAAAGLGARRACLAAFVVVAAASPARAQLAALASDDPDTALLAIEELARKPRPGAASAVSDLIRRGLPEPHLLAAVSTLAALRDRSAGPVLFDLLAHRRPQVRRLAVAAIATLRVPGAEAALRDALSDRDRGVRDAALAGLSAIAGAESVPTLFAALDRGQLASLDPLARLADDAQVPRLLERVGRLPIETLEGPVETLLLRTDLDQATRVAVVDAVADLGTATARAWLEALEARLPRRGVDVLRAAIRAAVARLPG